MLRWTGFVMRSLVIASLLPAAAFAADVVVGGQGPRVFRPHAPHVLRSDGRMLSNHGRPLFIVDDDFADFGELQTGTAPPLRIEVKGDVEIIPTPDGGLRIRFIED